MQLDRHHAGTAKRAQGEAPGAEGAVRTERSREQYDRARSVMPGGVAKGAYFHAPHPIYLASGDGCYVTSIDGERYLDFRGHHTAQVLGHGHPAVLEAVRAVVERGFALGGPVEAEYELAAELCCRVPSLERVRFTCSGTESTIHVLRLVRGWTGRQKVVKLEGGYHGSVDDLEVSVNPPLDRAGPPDRPQPVPSGRGFSRSAAEDTILIPYNDAVLAATILEQHRDEIAAVFLDPRAGILPIDFDFIRAIRRITQDLGLLLVQDEIVSFRLGPGGLQGLCGIRPDLTLFGKIVGGGFPLGGFGGRADIMDLLDPSGGPTGHFQSGTFSGHPVALAAGLATLRALTPDAYAHLDTLGQALRDRANDLFTRRELPAQAIGNGSLFAIHFTREPIRNHRAMRTADAARAGQVFERLLDERIMVSQGLTMNALSTPMQLDHVEAFISALDRALDDVSS